MRRKSLNLPDKRPARPHVALLVETSLGSGRDILHGIARYVREHAAWSLYYEPRGLEETVPAWLRHWKGDGIIARIQNQSIAAEVLAAGIPTVDVLGVVPRAPLPLVHVDDAQIAQLAAEHLLERGFRHFGYFGIEGENWSERRRDAFAASVRAAGSDLTIYELPRGTVAGQSWETMEDALERWIVGLPKPAGVMVASDQRGPQFLEACRLVGVQVPDEVAVIGVDDDEPLCEVCNPPLSSVQPDHAQVGYEAAALLDRLMHGQKRPRHPILIRPRSIATRLSSDVLAIADRKIATVLRLIREQACNGIRVDALARQVGLSRSVLQRRFRAALKRSLHQAILNVRLKRACELLTESDLSLADVAERAGFKHQEYLGAVFKRRLQTTPWEFRQAAQ
jgi:LacI family transcriptional regulator